MQRSSRQDTRPDQPPPPTAGLRALLAQYSTCPADDKPPSLFAFIRARNPHVFSHHAPTRADYLDHVWRIGGLYVCRGCTTVIIVTPVSFVVALLSRWPVRMPTWATAAVFAVLLAVALLPRRDGPRTLLHDLRRVALGALLGAAAAYLLLCDDWLLRGMVVGAYLAVLAGRRVWRGRSAEIVRGGNP
jgi:hypothetical protein